MYVIILFICFLFYGPVISYTDAAKIKKTQALSTAMLRMKDELDRLAIYGSRKKKTAQVSNQSKKKKAANRKAAKKARRYVYPAPLRPQCVCVCWGGGGWMCVCVFVGGGGCVLGWGILSDIFIHA